MKNNSVESEKQNIDINNSHLSHVNQNIIDSTITNDSHDTITNYYQQQEKERILPINNLLNILMHICYFFYNELGIKKFTKIYVHNILILVHQTLIWLKNFFIKN